MTQLRSLTADRRTVLAGFATDASSLALAECLSTPSTERRMTRIRVTAAIADTQGARTQRHRRTARRPQDAVRLRLGRRAERAETRADEDGSERTYPGRGQYVLAVVYEWTAERGVGEGDVLEFDLWGRLSR